MFHFSPQSKSFHECNVPRIILSYITSVGLVKVILKFEKEINVCTYILDFFLTLGPRHGEYPMVTVPRHRGSRDQYGRSSAAGNRSGAGFPDPVGANQGWEIWKSYQSQSLSPIFSSALDS